MLAGLVLQPASVRAESASSLMRDALALGKLDGSEAYQGANRGSLYFPETGFAVEEPKFVEYFIRRGRVPTFGFPISRSIHFQGLPTQFFQRIVIQLTPDGSVRP